MATGRVPIEAVLAPLIARQHGAFSRAQAARVGATRRVIGRRLATGRWQQLQPGVYRVAGTPPSWRQELIASCLTWGRGTVISHRAAAALWQLPGFEPAAVEITVPRGRGRVAARGAVVHWIPVAPADRTTIDGIPVTTVARTLIDLASVASPELVEDALDDALRRRLVSVRRIRSLLTAIARRGRPGVGVVRALLAERDAAGPVADSVFETRLFRALTRAGLPAPARQYRVRDGRRTIAVVDFAFPEARVAVEADGYRWHAGKRRWERDLARRNELATRGWRVVHVTWTDLTARREQLLGRLRAMLATGEAGASSRAISSPKRDRNGADSRRERGKPRREPARARRGRGRGRARAATMRL